MDQKNKQPTDVIGKSAEEENPVLDALNAKLVIGRPAKPKLEYGFRQFGDVIGKARSTLNVIDVWKSKLVSASSSVMARQLESSGSGEERRGFGSAFGSKNKNKNVWPPTPILGTSLVAARNEISTGGFSSVAAASKIKRRFFKRNKSVEFESAVPGPSDDSCWPVTGSVEANGKLYPSKDGIGLTQEQVAEKKLVNEQLHQRGSPASTLFSVDSERSRKRRCSSLNQEEDDYENLVKNLLKSSEKLRKENSTPDKLLLEDIQLREPSNQSLWQRLYEDEHHHIYCCHTCCCRPILLLDNNFDIDEFYYYYWKRKLPDVMKGHTITSNHSGKTNQQDIRKELKVQKVAIGKGRECEASRLSNKWSIRSFSDSDLHKITAESSEASMVDRKGNYRSSSNLTSYSSSAHTLYNGMLTQDDCSDPAPKTEKQKHKKKLSFKEPDSGYFCGTRGENIDSIHFFPSAPTYFQHRSGSLDSELEVLHYHGRI